MSKHSKATSSNLYSQEKLDDSLVGSSLFMSDTMYANIIRTALKNAITAFLKTAAKEPLTRSKVEQAYSVYKSSSSTEAKETLWAVILPVFTEMMREVNEKLEAHTNALRLPYVNPTVVSHMEFLMKQSINLSKLMQLMIDSKTKLASEMLATPAKTLLPELSGTLATGKTQTLNLMLMALQGITRADAADLTPKVQELLESLHNGIFKPYAEDLATALLGHYPYSLLNEESVIRILSPLQCPTALHKNTENAIQQVLELNCQHLAKEELVNTRLLRAYVYAGRTDRQMLDITARRTHQLLSVCPHILKNFSASHINTTTTATATAAAVAADLVKRLPGNLQDTSANIAKQLVLLMLRDDTPIKTLSSNDLIARITKAWPSHLTAILPETPILKSIITACREGKKLDTSKIGSELATTIATIIVQCSHLIEDLEKINLQTLDPNPMWKLKDAIVFATTAFHYSQIESAKESINTDLISHYISLETTPNISTDPESASVFSPMKANKRRLSRGLKDTDIDAAFINYTLDEIEHDPDEDFGTGHPDYVSEDGPAQASTSTANHNGQRLARTSSDEQTLKLSETGRVAKRTTSHAPVINLFQTQNSNGHLAAQPPAQPKRSTKVPGHVLKRSDSEYGTSATPEKKKPAEQPSFNGAILPPPLFPIDTPSSQPNTSLPSVLPPLPSTAPVPRLRSSSNSGQRQSMSIIPGSQPPQPSKDQKSKEGSRSSQRQSMSIAPGSQLPKEPEEKSVTRTNSKEGSRSRRPSDSVLVQGHSGSKEKVTHNGHTSPSDNVTGNGRTSSTEDTASSSRSGSKEKVTKTSLKRGVTESSATTTAYAEPGSSNGTPVWTSHIASTTQPKVSLVASLNRRSTTTSLAEQAKAEKERKDKESAERKERRKSRTSLLPEDTSDKGFGDKEKDKKDKKDKDKEKKTR